LPKPGFASDREAAKTKVFATTTLELSRHKCRGAAGLLKQLGDSLDTCTAGSASAKASACRTGVVGGRLIAGRSSPTLPCRQGRALRYQNGTAHGG